MWAKCPVPERFSSEKRRLKAPGSSAAAVRGSAVVTEGQEGLLQCSPTKWSVSYASKDKDWSESRFPDIEERCLGVTTITALLLVIPLR